MNYGGFWIRLVAYSVDSLVLFIALAGVAILLSLMGLSVAGGPILFLVVPVLYFAAMQSSARQATLGKQLVGLKVTDTNGGRISFLRSLARTVATIISSMTFMIGYLLAAFTSRKQALHDMIAGTLVVRDNPGKVVLALAVAVLGPIVMVGAAVMFAGAMVAGLAAGMMGEMAQAPKPPAVQVAKPAAQPAKPAAPAPAPTAAKPAAPAPTAAASAKPAPVAAAPEAPKMAEAPKAAPMKVAAAAPLEVKEVPRPVTSMAQEPKEEAKEDAKEEAKEEAKEDAPAKPAAVEAAPKPAAPAAPLVPKALLSGPIIQGPKYNDLTTAVLYRDAAAVNELISYGKWADKADSTGATPLMVAVSLGDAQIAEVLLKAGANPNKALPVAREKGNGAMTSLLERYGAR